MRLRIRNLIKHRKFQIQNFYGTQITLIYTDTNLRKSALSVQPACYLYYLRMTKKERYQQAIAYFEEQIPIAETELVYDNPFQLLVAVILSAQCTDKRVNLTTPNIFRKYPTPDKMAAASFKISF